MSLLPLIADDPDLGILAAFDAFDIRCRIRKPPVLLADRKSVVAVQQHTVPELQRLATLEQAVFRPFADGGGRLTAHGIIEACRLAAAGVDRATSPGG